MRCRSMGRGAVPYGSRDAVVIDRVSRHRGLRVTAVAFAGRPPRIRAYLHTPEWRRIVAMGVGEAAAQAADRAEELADRAAERGIPVDAAAERGIPVDPAA
jgi:hypothetical protein